MRTIRIFRWFRVSHEMVIMFVGAMYAAPILNAFWLDRGCFKYISLSAQYRVTSVTLSILRPKKFPKHDQQRDL